MEEFLKRKCIIPVFIKSEEDSKDDEHPKVHLGTEVKVALGIDCEVV
jgi:hypothetical protein